MWLLLGRGEVKIEKVSRCNELTPQGRLSWENEPDRAVQLRALRVSGPRTPLEVGAEAMANYAPYGPPFNFSPICEEEFNVPPAPGRDRWRSLPNGWRVRSFNPSHRNAPFQPSDSRTWSRSVHGDVLEGKPRPMAATGAS